MNPIQRRNLQLYQHFRKQPMTILRLFWANRRIYLFLLIIFGAFAALVYFAFDFYGAAIVGVALVVLMLRDFAFYRISVAIWPLLREILDWNKIDELLASDEIHKTPNRVGGGS